MKQETKQYSVKISTFDGGGDLNKRWHVSLYFTKPVRKRIQIYEGINRIRTKKARRKALSDLKAAVVFQLEQGHDFLGIGPKPNDDLSGGTLRELLDAVITKKKKELRPDSIYIYQASLNHFNDFCTGRGYSSRAQIKKAEVDEFKAYLLDHGCSKKSINVYMSCVRAIFGNLEGPNPFSNFGSLKVNDRKKRNVPFRDDHWKILKASLEKKHGPLLMLLQGLYYTGLRIRELVSLKRADIDLDSGRIFLKGANTKSGRTDTIRIPDKYLELLRSYLKDVPNSHFLFGSTITNQPHHTQANRSQLRFKFIRMREKLKLDQYGYTMYSSRHKIACDLLDQGVSLKNISLFLRHNSLRVTENYLRSMGRTVDEEVIRNFPEF